MACDFFLHFRVKGFLVSKGGIRKSESFTITYQLQGCVPKTLHLDLVFPPWGDSIQVLPAVSFWKRERYRLSYRGWAQACEIKFSPKWLNSSCLISQETMGV